jgi:hypothetical protein
LDAIKRKRKRNRKWRYRFILSKRNSMARSDRNNATKKRGRKVMKYLDVIKWVTLNHLQYSQSPAMGESKTAKRTREFLLCFVKIGKRIKRAVEAIIKGAKGTQSCKIP